MKKEEIKNNILNWLERLGLEPKIKDHPELEKILKETFPNYRFSCLEYKENCAVCFNVYLIIENKEIEIGFTVYDDNDTRFDITEFESVDGEISYLGEPSFSENTLKELEVLSTFLLKEIKEINTFRFLFMLGEVSLEKEDIQIEVEHLYEFIEETAKI